VAVRADPAGVASLFLDGVAAAVERRHYPALPPPDGSSTAAQVWSGVVLAAKMAGLTLVLLPLSLVLPMIGAIALWGVAAIGLGEGLFLGVAQRRLSPDAARRCGVPGAGRSGRWAGRWRCSAWWRRLNLLVPVLGTAAMVHLVHRPG
jgi:uncharacterized protein involved in cysteine biosynthesis